MLALLKKIPFQDGIFSGDAGYDPREVINSINEACANNEASSVINNDITVLFKMSP